MGRIIAVAGKGGTGKTTITALIIRALKELKKTPVLAIDADPNAALGEYLGLQVAESIGSIVDKVAKFPNTVPSGMPKERYLEQLIQDSIIESEGFDLLTMGRPEGPGCYCYINNLLRSMVAKLSKGYAYVVIDNEAGFEHLSRRTMRKADSLILVSDASKIGLRSALRINDLAKELELEIKETLLIVNKCFRLRLDKDTMNALRAVKIAGNIPQDRLTLKASVEGRSIFTLSAKSGIYNRLKAIGEQLWD